MDNTFNTINILFWVIRIKMIMVQPVWFPVSRRAGRCTVVWVSACSFPILSVPFLVCLFRCVLGIVILRGTFCVRGIRGYHRGWWCLCRACLFWFWGVGGSNWVRGGWVWRWRDVWFWRRCWGAVGFWLRWCEWWGFLFFTCPVDSFLVAGSIFVLVMCFTVSVAHWFIVVMFGLVFVGVCLARGLFLLSFWRCGCGSWDVGLCRGCG